LDDAFSSLVAPLPMNFKPFCALRVIPALAVVAVVNCGRDRGCGEKRQCKSCEQGTDAIE
jgi:hypothetical protein